MTARNLPAKIQRRVDHILWILEQVNLSHEYNWVLLSDDEVSLMVAFVDFLKSGPMVKENDLIEDSIYIFSLRPQ